LILRFDSYPSLKYPTPNRGSNLRSLPLDTQSEVNPVSQPPKTTINLLKTLPKPQRSDAIITCARCFYYCCCCSKLLVVVVHYHSENALNCSNYDSFLFHIFYIFLLLTQVFLCSYCISTIKWKCYSQFTINFYFLLTSLSLTRSYASRIDLTLFNDNRPIGNENIKKACKSVLWTWKIWAHFSALMRLILYLIIAKIYDWCRLSSICYVVQ
jgi:hypothetical protein